MSMLVNYFLFNVIYSSVQSSTPYFNSFSDKTQVSYPVATR